jgi:hypothetical protein
MSMKKELNRSTPTRPKQSAQEKAATTQLHRFRVLEVRIHSPPADSPCLAQTQPLPVENRASRAGMRGWVGGAVGRDAHLLVQIG